MSYGQAQLNSLLTDSTITSLLSDSSFIFNDTVVPDLVGAEESSINYYIVSPVNCGLNYLDADYSVNCRAKSHAEAQALALAVRKVVNRYFADGYGFRVSVLTVIPPQDPTDNYNAPLDVKVWGRTFD